MDKKEAIEYLKGRLEEIQALKQLSYDNQEYPLWRIQIEDILESIFGRDSREYQRFADAHPNRPRTTSIDRSAENRWYLDELNMRETAIKAIIQKYETLGIEENALNIKFPTPGQRYQTREVEKAPTGLAEPIHIFDAMQFHTKVIEASKSCFVTGNYREAILNAFISLIDCIKEITGLDLDGDDLMNNVFSFNYDKKQRKITKYPIISINELKNKTDRDEQYGFMFLCKGAAAFIRNPKAHKLIAQTDPLHTLEYLAFASLLFRQLDKRKINTP